MSAAATTSPLVAPQTAVKVMPALVLVVLGAVFSTLNHNFYSGGNIRTSSWLRRSCSPSPRRAHS